MRKLLKKALCWLFGHPEWTVEGHITHATVAGVSVDIKGPHALIRCRRCSWRPKVLQLELKNTAMGQVVEFDLPDRRGRMRFEPRA